MCAGLAHATSIGGTTNAIEVVGVESIEVTDSCSAGAVFGDGDLYKSGAGTFDVSNVGHFKGTMHVTAGTLRLTGVEPENHTLPTSGLVMHLDALRGVTVTTNAAGRVEASVWRSQVGDWSAVSATGTYYNADNSASVTIATTPQYVPTHQFCNRPTIQMMKSSSAGGECYRFRDGTGAYASITNIRTVLWVIGSQDGGGLMLGGGDPVNGTDSKLKYYAWNRNGYDKSASLTTSSSALALYEVSFWRVNGVSVSRSATDVLSGGWDTVSCVIGYDSTSHSVPADGLAGDGRVFNGVNVLYNCGNQRLAEVLIYTKYHYASTVIKQAEAYLNAKWGLNGAIDYFENDMRLDLAAGAVLDCGGQPRYVASLAGAGSVTGDLTAGELVADGASMTPVTVSGTFTIPANMKVAAVGLSGPVQIPLVSATAFEGTENLSSAVVTGIPRWHEGTLAVVDGTLMLDCHAQSGLTGSTNAVEVATETMIKVDDQYAAGAVFGDGDLYKGGTGTFDVSNVGHFKGTMHVEAGTLRLTGVEPENHTLPTDGLVMHLDALRGVTVTTNAGGRVEASVWRSQVGDWSAVSATGTYYNAGNSASVTIATTAQYVPTHQFCNRPTIQMMKATSAAGECYRFRDETGAFASITNIRTVLWVLGSQDGGGFLMGGGDPVNGSGAYKYYAWHRGGNGGTSVEDSLISGSSAGLIAIEQTSWRVNSVSKGRTASGTLSGGWDTVSCRVGASDNTYFLPADGLAFDGRVFIGQNYRSRCGNQRLAEVLIYTNRLGDVNLSRAENYLSAKWGLNGAIDYFENDMRLKLASGAVLDCNGQSRYVASLAGSGAVTGDLTAGELVADGASATPVTVSGTFSIPENMKIECVGDARDRNVPLVSATSFAGTENLRTIQVVNVPEGCQTHVRIIGGTLFLRCYEPKGMEIIFR